METNGYIKGGNYMSGIILLGSIISIAIGIFRSTGDGEAMRSIGFKERGDAHDRDHAASGLVLIIIGVLFAYASIVTLME